MMAESYSYIQKETEVFTLKHGSLEIMSIFLAQGEHRMLGWT